MKKFSRTMTLAVIMGLLVGCSSPEEKADEYIANARALFEENDLDKATLEFRNALQINQNLPDAWYGLARIHERKQEWKQAYGVLSRIRDSNPDHVDGRIMLAQLLLASNQIDEALEGANHVMELAPQDVRVHSLMAAVQFRLGDLEAAQKSSEKAFELDADNSESILVKARLLIANKKYNEAIVLLNNALQTQPTNASLYLMKMQAYSELDDQPAIDEVYKDMTLNFPENTAFKLALVRRHIQRGDLDAAERLLEQIAEENPDAIDAKQRLVAFKNQYRSADEAMVLIKRYIQENPREYQFHFLLAGLYQAQKKFDEVVALYRDIIVEDGVQTNGLEARNRLALIYLRSGRADEARVLVNEVLEYDKTNENGLLLQAGFYIAESQFDDAIIGLRTVLRDNPKSIKALGLIGQAYTSLGSMELAVESYSKAFALSPQTPAIAHAYARVLMRQNNTLLADEVLASSIASGNSSIQALKLQTQIKLMLGDWDFAEKLALQLKDEPGEEAVSEQMLGMVYKGREQTEESISAFKRAHELAPNATQPVVALVQAYVKNGKQDEARQFLNKIISEDEKNVTATLLLGQLAMQENDRAKAIEYFNRVSEINPKLDASYRTLASIYIQDSKFGEAERVLKEGLVHIPDNTALSIALASVYQLQDNIEKSISIYEDLLQKNSGLIVVKNNLASMLTDYRDDQASFERARRLASDFRNSDIDQFRDTYSWANVRAGLNLEEATNILEDIVKKNEGIGVYRYHLGEALRRKGDIDNAVIQLNKVLELEKQGSPVAEKAKQSLQLVSQ